MTAPALPRLPRGSGPAPVAGVAAQLLDWVVAWYGERSDPDDDTTPRPLPARRFLAAGAPREVPWDTLDGQVTVAVERVLTALDPTAAVAAARSPRGDPGNVGRIHRSVALEIQVVRCVPLPEDPMQVPDPGLLHAQAVALDADAGHLLTAAADAVRGGVLLREHVAQAPITLGDTLTLGPMGGAAAVALLVTVPLL